MSSTTVERPQAEARWFIHNLARVLVDGDATGGAYCVVEMHGRPGDTPPPHVHHADDEGFIVLEGSLTLRLANGRVIELGPGQSAVAPRGIPHIYEAGEDGAHWLVTCSPAGFENFVLESSTPAEVDELPPADTPVDGPALAAAAARYGIELLGPGAIDG